MGTRKDSIVLRAGLVVLALAGGFAGCGVGRAKPPPKPLPGNEHKVVCAPDEVREYYCDDLVPPSATLPAPAPYEACPSTIEDPRGQFDPEPSVAEFDPSYTGYTRKRAPPGHSCCYSWCSKVMLADPGAPSVQASCQTGRAFREEYCMPELESGSAIPAGPPFERCPIAIQPPSRAVFQVPEAAVLDATATMTRRGRGDQQCCYAWCSQAPAGSGLLKSR